MRCVMSMSRLKLSRQNKRAYESSSLIHPVPLVAQGQPVDWWFVFKFNAASFPECDGEKERKGIFGGTPKEYHGHFSQQYVFASSADPALQKGKGCVGATLNDPVGATFGQVYNNACNYVIWNDQFYDDPRIHGCEKACGAPWGHSKGMLAWNDSGEGFVMQVSTPSWLASGSKKHPRKTDGNTLGCIKDDDIEVSQHFFSLKINKDDLVKILKAMQNSSVVTDPFNLQIVQNGGPDDVKSLVGSLGVKSKSTECLKVELSSGVTLLSKPSKLHVPPWQMVSAQLEGLPLRVASWWAYPEIPSTGASTSIKCWDDSLGKPGAVEIATTGNWQGKEIGLKGGEGLKFNHAKIGVSQLPAQPLSIFGDMNQQGALYEGEDRENQKCDSSQNGCGGLFYVIENTRLFASVSELLKGDLAPE